MKQLLRDEAELLHTFAHDLRHPLRVMLMQAQRLQRRRDGLEDDIRERLVEMEAAARTQDELIRAVVEFYDARSHGMDTGTLVSLRNALQTACMKVDAYRETQHGRITVDEQSVPHVKVPSGLAVVLEKLMHNALKFHVKSEAPIVQITAAESDGGYEVTIVDKGIGIEPEFQGKVFAPFLKLNSPEEYPGYGMGLATARCLMESIGGGILFPETDAPGLKVRVEWPKPGAAIERD